MTTPLTASFTAALDAVGLTPRVFASAAPLVAAQLDSAGPGTDVGLWLARALNYVALTAIVGLLLTAVAFVPDSVGLERAGRSATRMSAFAAGALLLSDVALLVFGGSSASGRPLPQVVDPAILVAPHPWPVHGVRRPDPRLLEITGLLFDGLYEYVRRQTLLGREPA